MFVNDIYMHVSWMLCKVLLYSEILISGGVNIGTFFSVKWVAGEKPRDKY